MREVAANHGYYYDGVQLGEFYQLKFALELAREMERLCEDAWLIQTANPVFNCCTLLHRESSIKSCGLCHGHLGHRDIARAIGIDAERVSTQAAGFNHNIWLSQCCYEGKDVYPLIDRWIEEEAERYWRSHRQNDTHDIQMSRAAVHQYRMYGLFPVGDTVRRVGGVPSVGCTVNQGEWWLHSDPDMKRFWFGEPWGGPDSVAGRRHFESVLSKRLEEMRELARDPNARLVDSLGSVPSGEQIVPLIDSLVNDGAGEHQVNVPNPKPWGDRGASR